MDTYDPNQAPLPAEWLRLDEQEQMHLVQNYHRTVGVDLPNEQLHVVVHTVVENQLAMDELATVQRTLHRLLAAGVDRHGAIHAIGSVLAEHMHELATGKAGSELVNERYEASLEDLDARDWRAS